MTHFRRMASGWRSCRRRHRYRRIPRLCQSWITAVSYTHLVEQTMERLVQRTKLPDKQTDPLGWAGTMNSLRQQAEETAMELIYGS